MNDDPEPPAPLNAVGDEALEARIVAWVLGVASAFEAAELERLCAERPELLVFRRRMLALHGLLAEAEADQPDPQWQLSPEKRAKLGELYHPANGEAPAKPASARPVRTRKPARVYIMRVAACILLPLLGVTSYVIYVANFPGSILSRPFVWCGLIRTRIIKEAIPSVDYLPMPEAGGGGGESNGREAESNAFHATGTRAPQVAGGQVSGQANRSLSQTAPMATSEEYAFSIKGEKQRQPDSSVDAPSAPLTPPPLVPSPPTALSYASGASAAPASIMALPAAPAVVAKSDDNGDGTPSAKPEPITESAPPPAEIAQTDAPADPFSDTSRVEGKTAHFGLAGGQAGGFVGGGGLGGRASGGAVAKSERKLDSRSDRQSSDESKPMDSNFAADGVTASLRSVDGTIDSSGKLDLSTAEKEKELLTLNGNVSAAKPAPGMAGDGSDKSRSGGSGIVVNNGGSTISLGGDALDLNGANTYSGATTVSGGTLAMDGKDRALGDIPVAGAVFRGRKNKTWEDMGGLAANDETAPLGKDVPAPTHSEPAAASADASGFLGTVQYGSQIDHGMAANGPVSASAARPGPVGSVSENLTGLAPELAPRRREASAEKGGEHTLSLGYRLADGETDQYAKHGAKDQLMRSGDTDEEIKTAALDAVNVDQAKRELEESGETLRNMKRKPSGGQVRSQVNNNAVVINDATEPHRVFAEKQPVEGLGKAVGGLLTDDEGVKTAPMERDAKGQWARDKSVAMKISGSRILITPQEQALKALEDQVEEKRKVLSSIVRTKRIVYQGNDSSFKQPAETPPANILASMDETAAGNDPYSTFSLHVSDASFKLAKAALDRGSRPDPTTVRPEEFYNAFDYGDPAPAADEPVACTLEQAAHPVLPQRNLVRIAARVGSAGRSAAQPLVLTVLLDSSGSMEREDRREGLKNAVAQLASLLHANDRVTLVTFSRTPRLLADSLPGSQAEKLKAMVANTPSEGGTNLEEALKLGGALARRQKQANAQNRIVLLTDGAANLGDASPEHLAGLIHDLRQQGIAFDAAGIGADGLNDRMLEELTRNGNGRYYIINNPEDADANFAKQLAGAFRPAAVNVKVQVRFNPERVGRYKLIGFEQHRLRTEDFRNDKVAAAELAADEAGVALYQVETLPEGRGEVGEVSIRFRDASGGGMVERTWTIPYDEKAPAFDRSTPSMQLATLADLVAEKLRGSELGKVADFQTLAGTVARVRNTYQNNPRVADLVSMIEKLK